MSNAAVVHPLRVPDFRRFWIGESISLIGDQFYLIALPWLVLQLTSSALTLGIMLALTGVARILFMLLGGVLVDRFSPRSIMFAANLVRLTLVTVLALLVLTDQVQLWMLYLLTFAFGTADAFYFPAQSAMIPVLLSSDQLEVGNTLTQSMTMMSIFVGPLVAGTIIGAFADFGTGSALHLRGIGIMFALDALSFLASLLSLWLIRTHRVESRRHPTNVIISIREGLSYVRASTTLSSVLVLFVGMYLFINGPFDLGVAVLAKNTLAEGAAAFGLLISAYGGGALVGVLLTSILPPSPPLAFGTLLIGVSALSGVAMILIPMSSLTFIIALISFGIGVTMGYVEVQAMIWLQRRIPEHLMGRVMSLIAIASAAIAPLSSGLAGAIAEINPASLFIGAGGLMTLTSLALLAQRPARQMGLEVVESKRKTTLAQALRTTREVAVVSKRATQVFPPVLRK